MAHCSEWILHSRRWEVLQSIRSTRKLYSLQSSLLNVVWAKRLWQVRFRFPESHVEDYGRRVWAYYEPRLREP